MINMDFYLNWGSMYNIELFGLPKETVMYLGRSNGFIICCSENELHEDWISKGFARVIPSAMAENVYMVPESTLWPRPGYEYPKHIYESINFETVDTMVSTGIISDSDKCAAISYLWNIDENSRETEVLKWFTNKLLSINDFKLKERQLSVYLKISENMLKVRGIKRYVIDIYIKYMSIVGTNMVCNSEERVKSICEFQTNQLPF